MRKGLSKRNYRMRSAVTFAALLLAAVSGAALLPAADSARVSAQDCSQPSFTAAAPAAVGMYPTAMTSGDFNNDGKFDLAVANYLSNDVSVLLGNGTGGFAAAVNFGNVSSPFSIAASDLDNDGNTDLAVVNSGSDDVTVLKGNGLGGFSFGGQFGVGSLPISIAAADLNGDGNSDLAVSNYISNDVSVLIGNGSGGFASAFGYAAGTAPVSVATGDFDLNGTIDLAVANSTSNAVSILSGSGDGSFAFAGSFAVGVLPGSVAVGDLDGDGDPDVATANGSGDASVVLNNGSGGFGAATNWPAGVSPFGIVARDFNRDGILDLATSNIGSADTSVLFGTGGGNFAPGVNFVVGSEPGSILSGDIDGNGSPDLAVANRSSDSVSILLNNCVGSPAPTIATAAVSRRQGAGPSRSAVATVNDAGDAETALVVTVNGETSATVNGVSVSGISVDAAGNVEADVAASCGSSNASFTLRVTNSGGSFAEAVLDVTVTASSSPTIGLNPSISLFPHNGKMLDVPLSQMVNGVSDDCDLDLSANVVIEKVTSDEGDSNSFRKTTKKSGGVMSSTESDIIIGGDCRSVTLRASRDNNGNGRVYSVTLRVTDSSGNTTRANHKVTVPLSPSAGPAVEDAPVATVLSSCP